MDNQFGIPKEKLASLERILGEMGGLLVAFSGGVDSAFLLACAHKTLGEKAVALVALSPSLPDHESREAKSFADSLGVRCLWADSHEMDIEGYRENTPNRCYYCKTELFSLCRREADRLGIPWIADGMITDDLRDYRPGGKAAEEKGIRHPLAEADLSKEDVRAASRAMGLATWDKPATACLASRFPYGTEITRERLERIDACEGVLRRAGFRGFRVRFHDSIARVELPREQFPRFLEPGLREKIIEGIKAQGFSYVVLDLDGYRSGSLNRVLSAEEKEIFS